MNSHNKMEGTSAIKHKKELETLDTQRFLALLQLLTSPNKHPIVLKKYQHHKITKSTSKKHIFE